MGENEKEGERGEVISGRGRYLFFAGVSGWEGDPYAHKRPGIDLSGPGAALEFGGDVISIHAIPFV